MIPAELNVDQTVAYASDQFEVALNDSQAYLDGVSAAALSTGLLDPYLVPELVEHIGDGKVDSIELHVVPNKLSAVVRGRDAAGIAADTIVNMVFSVTQEQPEDPDPAPGSIPGFPSMPIIVGVTVPETLYGDWTARTIAQNLVAKAGIGLVWDTEDYRMRTDFSVNGSVIDAIQSLVEPFSHFQRSLVDIWSEGATLIVRLRNGPPPGLSVSVHDMRITDLLIKDTFLAPIRVVRLSGSRTGTNLNVAVDPGDRTNTTEDEILDPVTEEVISRIVTTEVVRVLDGAVKSQIIETYQDATNDQGVLTRMALVSRKVTASNWDDLVLAYPNKIMNTVREHSNICTEEGLDPAASTTGPNSGMVPMVRTSIGHSYDDEGYLKAQHTKKELWDDTPTPAGPTGWILDEAETKQYRRSGTQMFQVRTTKFDASGSPIDVRRVTGNGTPPGGPGRSTFGGGAGETQETVTFATVISLEPGGKDFSLSNANLLVEQLAIIAAQAAATSEAVEHEASFTAAGIPWIRRGQGITLTGLFAENGTTPIPIGPALVTQARFEYRESAEPGGDPTYLTYVKALWWTGGS